jgi:hypothetical protein
MDTTPRLLRLRVSSASIPSQLRRIYGMVGLAMLTVRSCFRLSYSCRWTILGMYVIDMEELDRVEVRIGASEGHLLVAGERRSLPIGSTLRGGTFYWQAGPGFLGEYELVFERLGAEPVRVRVVIHPKSYSSLRPQR